MTSFYGQSNEEEIDEKTSYFANLIGELVKRFAKNTDDATISSVDYKEFSLEAAAQLNELLFVKFQDATEHVKEGVTESLVSEELATVSSEINNEENDAVN